MLREPKSDFGTGRWPTVANHGQLWSTLVAVFARFSGFSALLLLPRISTKDIRSGFGETKTVPVIVELSFPAFTMS